MIYDEKLSGEGEAVSPEDQQHQLEIYLFGGLEFSLNGTPIGGNVTSKAKGLLAFLAVEADHSHRRESLAEMFWPERPQGTARNSLRQAIAALRQSLEDTDSALPYLLPTAKEIQFNLDSQFFLDVREFERLVRFSLNHDHDSLQACAECEDRLQRAVGLYQDDFLIDASLPDTPEFDNWVVTRRETYRRDLSKALRVLISMHEDRNDYREGSRLARKLVELEPWDEANHRVLMRSLALAGMRSAALKQYQACKRILAAEFEVEPSTQTIELYNAIRDERLFALQAEPAPRLLVDQPYSNSVRKRNLDLGRVRLWQWGLALGALSIGALVILGGIRFGGADPTDLGDDASGVGRSSARIVASVEGDWFWIHDILPDTILSMFIYEADDRSNELWHETVITDKSLLAENGGIFNVFPWDHGIDLVPGNLIVVSDELGEAALILERSTMDVFDVSTDSMAGTAPPDRFVLVTAAFGPDTPQQHKVGVTSDAQTGEWMIDFASMGIDLTDDWRSWSFAYIFDEDGDINEASAIYAGSR